MLAGFDNWRAAGSIQRRATSAAALQSQAVHRQQRVPVEPLALLA